MSTDRVTFYALAHGDEQIERRSETRFSHCASYGPTLAAQQGQPEPSPKAFFAFLRTGGQAPAGW